MTNTKKTLSLFYCLLPAVCCLLLSVPCLLLSGCGEDVPPEVVKAEQDSMYWSKRTVNVKDTVLLDFIHVLRKGNLEALKSVSLNEAWMNLVDTSDTDFAMGGSMAFWADNLVDKPRTIDYVKPDFLMVYLHMKKTPSSFHFRKIDGQWVFLGKYLF